MAIIKSRAAAVDDDDDSFVDANEDFPFHDCVDTDDEQHRSSSLSPSPSPSISRLEPASANVDLLLSSQNPVEAPSPGNRRRRRRFLSRRTHKIVADDGLESSRTANSPASSENITISRKRNQVFSRISKKNEQESEKSNLFKFQFSSEEPDTSSNGAMEDSRSTLTTANDENFHESGSIDSHSGQVNGSIWRYPFLLTGLLIKALGFQIHLFISFLFIPIWLLYHSYKFIIDPFGSITRFREYLIQKLLGIWCLFWEILTNFVYECLEKHKSILKLGFKFLWGMIWSIYVGIVLIFLLIWAFATSGLLMNFFVEKPIRMKEALNFDYTKSSPVAYVPIISCSNSGEKLEHGNGYGNGIPHGHRLHIAVTLTLPESDYNRNLGMFQVRLDFLSSNGKTLESSSRPSILHFKSKPLRLLSTLLNIFPLVRGRYVSETQNLKVKFRTFNSGKEIQTSCLKIVIEQRAEYGHGAGVPEIYGAFLILETKLPFMKRILWNWKGTIFVWLGMIIFGLELFLGLLCCKPILLPRVRRNF